MVQDTPNVQTLARLTQLTLDDSQASSLTETLTGLFSLCAHIPAINTANTAPLISPLDLAQRLRADVVSETDQRDRYQQLAPAVQDGLYLVPKVLD